MTSSIFNVRVWALLIVVAAVIATVAMTQFVVGDASGATTGIPKSAAYYVKFEGIEGESIEKDHTGWIEILSFDQAIRSPVISGAGATGSTRQRGSVVLEDIVVTKELDKSSPKLAQAITSGQVFPKVEIHVTSSYTDTGRVTYYAYELTNVFVTSYSVGGSSSANDAPLESFSLNFGEIKVAYDENDSAGRSKGKVEYSWKVEEGTS